MLVPVLCTVPAGIAFWLYRRWVQGAFYTRDVRLEDTVVLITGANTGIGKETAIDLARRGARVYIACRDVERGEAAKKDIIYQAQSHNVIFRQLDLASKSSILQFVQSFRESEKRLDVLINNAGVFGCTQSQTEFGAETHIGVNHLGHFFLTNLLIDLLKKAAPGRVINVSSMGHLQGKIHREDLMMEKNYDPVAAYCQSKLANVLFTRELARRFKPTEVVSFSLHPGGINTDIWRYMQDRWKIFKPLLKGLSFALLRTPVSGAQTQIYLACEPDIEDLSGCYFDNLQVAVTNPEADDEELAQWLWDESNRLMDTNF